MMLIALIGLLFGVILGFISPFEFPQIYFQYVALVILACFDTVLGGIRAFLFNEFHFKIFVSGFLCNGILAVFLSFIGKTLGVNLQIAVILVYGTRLFNNFTIIRKKMLNKFKKHDTI